MHRHHSYPTPGSACGQHTAPTGSGRQTCSCPRAAVEWCLPRLPLRPALGPNEAATENGPSHTARLEADTRSSPKPAPSPSS
ncbi:hypothetical protein CCHR01_03428 [Colletotrichum chrysophilum]|uniref:Uncharacterized protein n=1 Tax=Colletotrichum chrysophilum TaxID=1836956 RepID=A0AAD9EME8_9PEZI|nr:hypothetical protein CCHR01_03428 [Colletotrichum chrysophilum]